MNCILTVLYLLTIIAGVLCKAVLNTEDKDVSRYAYNYAINDILTKSNEGLQEDKAGYRTNGSSSLLGPDGGLRSLVEYNVDDFNGFSDILNSLTASLKKSLPLENPFPLSVPPINPLINPLSYGFGAEPLAAGTSKITVSGSSIPWDPKTRSYGGWVPLPKPARKVPYAKIVSKKYVNGQIYKVKTTSIPVTGNKIIVKRRPKSV